MKTYPGIDYTFRPAGYWDEADPLQAILRNVKGEVRRQRLLALAAEGRLEEVPDEVLPDGLDPAVRKALGRVHPALMGGEYLPDYLPGEVEIARICLESTTADVISLRARPLASGEIGYRVVDEYDGVFTLPIASSAAPLTLAQLVGPFRWGHGVRACCPNRSVIEHW